MEKTPNNESGNPLIEMIDATIASLQTETAEAEGIHWRVFPGNFWVIGGWFGSGKGDFLMTAAGLQRPLRGVVKIFGHETFRMHEELLVEHRRRIGMVFSGGGRLFNRLSVAENVALPLRYHRNWTEADAESAVREILQLTETLPFAHRIPSSLSPNWQHRVALARALILHPEILLLDKPLYGMDARHQRWWLDFLGKLSQSSAFNDGKRMTLVVTAENFQPWKDVAGQFAVLKNNRWQEIGGRAELDASSELLQNEVWADES